MRWHQSNKHKKPHRKNGWYLDSAPENYRCHKPYIKESAAERIACTVELFPHNYSLPKLSPKHNVLQADADLVKALNRKQPDSILDVIPKQTEALSKLTVIFKKLIKEK